MSRVHQALKKAEMAREKDKDIVNLPEKIFTKSSFDEHLVSFFDTKSIAAEQYRKLRTRILQFPDFAPRTILITSATSEEGKSLTAANLAITISQGVDEHVLLIDSDLRRPTIPGLFGLNPQCGLADYLTGDTDLSKILIETGIPKLKLLPAGSFSERPSELIASNKMKSLVNELKTRYEDRYIIIDSSPVMVTDEPDILADQVDGIILVIRAGSTPREAIEKTLDSLSGKNIIGVVFNANEITLKRAYYGYYQYRY